MTDFCDPEQRLDYLLQHGIDAYNKAIGSLESRVLVSARKFSALGVVGSESPQLAELSPIEAAPRHLQAVDLFEEDEGSDPTIVVLPEGGASSGHSA